MDIKNILIKNRPQLIESSQKTYISILQSLYKKIYPDDIKIDVNKYNDTDIFIKYLLKNKEASQRKTYLSALYVFTNKDDYKNLMIEDIKKHNIQESKQEKNQKQTDNWIEQDELKNIINMLETNIKHIYKLKHLSIFNLQDIQDYIILCLVSGYYIAPRRSIDWTELKIKNYDESTDNYLKKNEFTFNIYKTFKFKGRQKVKMNNTLNRIIKKWFKINPTDYLLFDSNYNKLTNVQLTQRLNKILNRKASINILRHSYITEKHKKINTLNEIEKTADEMGHGLKQHLEYIKN